MENQPIHFVTGNSAKVKSMQRYATQAGIEVLQTDLPDIIEPQSLSIETISRSKAMQAYAVLQKPLVVNDAGAEIDGWNGFPGAYTKDFVQSVGIDNILHAVSNLEDRRCRFRGVLTYVDEHGMQVFHDTTEGTLAQTIDRTPKPAYHWSDLQRMFIPEKWNKIISSFTEDDYLAWHDQRQGKSVFSQFVRWMKEK